jgi:NAD-dependent SIR2 family protein deacetylase
MNKQSPWTITGSINERNQRNNGKTGEIGSDHGQKFYEMECLYCNFKYKANGTDIFQRKCPRCQGGRP